MSEERFIMLVKEHDGFEYYQAYRDDDAGFHLRYLNIGDDVELP